MVIGTLKRDRTYLSVRLADIPAGVSARDVGAVPAFLVRQGDRVDAYVAAVAPNHAVVRCNDGFVDADTKERIPVERLQRLQLTVRDTQVRIYPDKITAPPGERVFTPQVTGDWQDRALHPSPADCS
jgi:hypothetical protein